MAKVRSEDLVQKLADQIVGRLNQKNLEEIEIAHSNSEVGGSLILIKDGSWKVTSNRRNSYVLKGPTIKELLKKYARLEDEGFHVSVGSADMYDSDEMYEHKSERHVKEHHNELLDKFIGRLRSILTERL